MLGKDTLLALRGLAEKPGDSGELVVGCEYFRWLWPNVDDCDKLTSSAWRVASVIESVEIEVTELWRLLLVTDAAEFVGVSTLPARLNWYG